MRADDTAPTDDPAGYTRRMKRRVLVLGSTGSIGTQSLDVLGHLTDTHEVVGLSARSSVEALAEQVAAHGVDAACLVDERAASGWNAPAGVTVFSGPDGLLELVRHTRPDVVICGITGAAGLPSTLEAARAGATLGLANKESMVLAGALVKSACAASGGVIVPVDSEHCAVAQCLEATPREALRRVILTASGGPFRGRRREELAEVTVEQALKHPSWEMGPRITIDSATLMNKALEVVEACQLFDLPADQVDVIVHPQSVVHSFVEAVDGSMLCQLGPPDMRVPIRYALGHPGRVEGGARPIDIAALTGLTFEAPDRASFPCLALGERVARSGGLAGTILNAANEVAVDAFLSRRLAFLGIPEIVEDALDAFATDADADPDSLDTILALDARVRDHATARLASSARY